MTIWVLAFSLLGPLGTLIGSGLLWRFPVWRARGRTTLVAFAVGSLMAAALTALLPEAIALDGVTSSLDWLLGGFLGYFLLEKGLRLPHRHAEPRVRPVGILVLVGDGLHNLIDGVVVALAFRVSVPVGIVTSLAVFAHELPQEFGEFAVLVESGLSPGRAYALNVLVAAMIVPGAILGLWLQALLMPILGEILALAAAGFFYIAATDLAPILHEESGLEAGFRQAVGLVAGAGLIWGLHQLLG